MESKNLWTRMRDEGKSFFGQVARSNEAIYLVLLSLYVSMFCILTVGWDPDVSKIVYMIRYGVLSLIIWGAALYLLYVIAAWKNLWKKTVPLIIIAVCVLALTGWYSTKMSTNSFTVVMDMFFCLMACGKDYKKILRCVMFVVLGTLILACVGMPLSVTMDIVKPENANPGHSLGIDYPNNWGYLTFLVLMIAWYLWMRRKPLVVFPVFWGVSAFMYFYICCRTIAILAVVFPVIATAADMLEQQSKKKDEKTPGHKGRLGIIGWIFVALPFLAFAFMMIVSLNVEWVHDHFYYTKLHNFAMRFVQGGLYFRTYGLPIFGNPYRSNVHTYVNVSGDFLKVGILDSSFAAYIIMRGLVWLAYTLAWLSFAIWKALKRRDYAIPFLCGIILVFAMMERPGLDMWYNFILLYPLAKVAGDPPEPAPAVEPEEPAAELPSAEPVGTGAPEADQ